MGAEPEVMLIEYSLRRATTGNIELLPNMILDTSVAVSRRSSMPRTIEDHFKNKEEMRRLFDALIARIREFEPSVEPVPMIHYINLRTGYCGVQVAKQHLRIHARGKMDHPHFREWSSATSRGKRGEGGVVTVGNEDLDERLMQWIHGAFEIVFNGLCVKASWWFNRKFPGDDFLGKRVIPRGSVHLHSRVSLMRFSSCVNLLCCAKIIDRSSGISLTVEARTPTDEA